MAVEDQFERHSAGRSSGPHVRFTAIVNETTRPETVLPPREIEALAKIAQDRRIS